MTLIALIFAAANVAAEPASLTTSWWAPAIVAAIVAAAVSLITFGLAGRRERLDRQRQVFADAFEAVMEYREYPYIVRRRNPSGAAEERRRISGELSRVQARLNAYGARLLIEDRYVGDRYDEVVKRTRQIVGATIKVAWDNEPVSADEDMHAPPYDFSEIEPVDETYLRAVADHLGWVYAPARRKLREWQRGRGRKRA